MSSVKLTLPPVDHGWKHRQRAASRAFYFKKSSSFDNSSVYKKSVESTLCWCWVILYVSMKYWTVRLGVTVFVFWKRSVLTENSVYIHSRYKLYKPNMCQHFTITLIISTSSLSSIKKETFSYLNLSWIINNVFHYELQSAVISYIQKLILYSVVSFKCTKRLTGIFQPGCYFSIVLSLND